MDDLNCMKINPQKYVEKIKDKKTPYEADVLGTKISINTNKVYPPGKLASFFANYLIQNLSLENKIIADIGAGCSTLGIILAKNGAGKVIGVDVNEDSIECSLLIFKSMG